MLPGKADIKNILQQFNALYPNDDTQEVLQFITTCSENSSLYDRKNYIGHITASAVIADSQRQLLLVLHRVFNRWMAPGGHVEMNDGSLLHGAVREAIEETGIKETDIEIVSVIDTHPEVPFDIDSHPIPENNRKNEPAHVHHDFRYLFRYIGDGNLQPDPEETKGAQWISFGELEKISDMHAMLPKLESVLR